jgi:cytochrome c553
MMHHATAFPELLALAVGFATAAHATNWQIPREEITKTVAQCESCHGPEGNSTNPATPRLNGQHYQYIVNELRGFRDPTRQDPHAINTMWPVATQTGDEMIFALASYFSSRVPTEPPRRNDALAAAGRRIFMEGVRAENVPACQSCHGVQGQGSDTVPRLVGQHAVYLVHAMESLRFALRESNVMHPELNRIDEEQIKALVAYLAKD